MKRTTKGEASTSLDCNFLNSLCSAVYDDMIDLTDYTINGKCSGCGRCCSNYLPISESEYLQIGRYIHKHNIMGYRNPLDLHWKDSCPFLNGDNKCMIYDIRPKICRSFKCDLQRKNKINFVDFIDGEYRKVVNMWDSFYEDL